jgi:hypothetical protein
MGKDKEKWRQCTGRKEDRCINYCSKDVHVDITFIAYYACLVVHRYNVDDKLLKKNSCSYANLSVTLQ